MPFSHHALDCIRTKSEKEQKENKIKIKIFTDAVALSLLV
jgi:hypothetical protein